MTTLSEQLTTQFYKWEQLGRGWMVGEQAVQLEPPFTPFFGHFPPPTQDPIDDGSHHTLLSGIASLFKQKQVLCQIEQQPQVSYDLYAFNDETRLVTFRLHIPKGYKVSTSETISWLLMLSYCASPLSIEYLATKERIVMQIGCREQYTAYLKGQLRTYFPDINVSDGVELPDFIKEEENAIAVTDFGLQEEFMRPMVQYGGGGIDPFTSIFSILDNLQEDQSVVLQILFNGVVNQWQQSILRSVRDNKQGDFFKNAPEMLPLAKDKISVPLFAVAIRLLTQAPQLHDALQLLEQSCFAVTQASQSSSNALIPLPHEAYTIEHRVIDIAFRESHRAGMLLNVRELAAFAHIPLVQSKKLLDKQRKTKAAPAIAQGHSLILGTNEHDGHTIDVSVNNEQRLKHTHIIGATGTGKSTLLLSMIDQDIRQGNGVAVLDPHGDLIEAVLSRIPKERIQDVIIVDPADREYPVSFNILHAYSDIEKEVLSSDLVAIFKRNSTSWGDQMNSVFGNAVISFLESTKGGTLADLRRFLIEKDFREQFLKTVTDPGIQYYWHKEYPLLKTSSVGPILTRLDSFLRPKLIRNMVCQKKGLNFEDILDTKKILLVKLSQGLIGMENSYLLGSFMVSKIHQAAIARQAKNIRKDFFFYIDEFQHFITPSMSGILSGARKYHLGLILAHQDMQQLQKYDTDLANTVVSNAGTRICFRVGELDARKLADGFSSFEPVDLQNLAVGEAIGRIEKPGFDFSFETTPIDDPIPNEGIKEKILFHSRNNYATPRNLVEADLARSMAIDIEEPEVKTFRKNELQSVKKEEKRQAPPIIFEKSEGQAIPIKSSTSEAVVQKKEESQHRYLQTLIKKMAEARGFKATLETATPDGLGKVDVLLEKDTFSIACEVSVTTDANWELHNIEKCLTAGYSSVITCVTDKKVGSALLKKIHATFSKEQLEKVKVFEPEALFTYLDSINLNESPVATETTYKGYRVKVNYDSVNEEEMKRKRDSITGIVVNALKKLKK
jgi:hypothetical protein